MNNFRKSVPKPAPGAGTPKGKNANVTVIHKDDITFFPPTDENGVLLVGNIALRSGAKMHRVYMTDDNQKITHEYEGDADMGGYKKKFEATHPGDEIEINEYIQNNNEEPFILIYDLDCNTKKRKVVGLPCNPMYLKGTFEDSKDGVKHTLMFEQRRHDRHVSKFYEGELSFAENNLIADAAFVNLNSASFINQLPAVNTADTSVGIVGLSADNNKVFTLIGGGGTNPATLVAEDLGVIAGEGWNVTVLLNNGTEWVALKDAVINLRVYDAGAKVYLQEISRS